MGEKKNKTSMKQIVKKLSLALTLLAVCGWIWSCDKEDEKLKDLTVKFEQETYTIEQGQSIEIPFSIGNVAGASVGVLVQSDNADEYPAAISENEKGKGTITVTAPQYILSPATVTVTVTVTDEINKRTATGSVTVTSATDEAYSEITVPANCYIAAPGAIVKFPAHIGNTEALASFATASLLWQDKTGLVNQIMARPAEKAVVVVLNPELEGNALVGVKDADGEIVWSYHLWITSSDPRPDFNAGAKTLVYTDTTTNVTYEMMDRYLGAVSNKPGSDASNGLFYQWGRKDPFAASNYENALKDVYDIDGNVVERIVTPVEQSDNIETAIKNPTTHYSGVGGGNYSWISSNKGELPATKIADLWGGVSGTQTVYDPCPAGWRVAPSEAWKFYNDKKITVEKVFKNSEEGNANLQGRLFDGFWFPAQGEVPHGGKFTNGIGSNWPNGKAWSSSIDADNYRAWATSSSPTSVSWRGGIGFGYGLPVRCVRVTNG